MIPKGQIRNEVLKQVKNLNQSIKVLEEALSIKSGEVKEYEDDPDKVMKLKRQVKVIRDSIDSIKKSVRILEKYKGTTVSYRYPREIIL